MKYITAYIRYSLLYIVVALFFACQQPGVNSTGSEYMPDMGHSIAYEANYYNYYYHNTWGSEDDYYQMAFPREPVPGTIARGYAGGASGSTGDVLAHAPNGSVPYYYGNNDAERVRAADEIIDNPYPITDAGLAEGKELYDLYCGICHGAKGDGGGYLARDGSPYPVQPANLLLPTFIDTTNGAYYHTIMRGKNKMGAYNDKLDYQERWQVIHYIRSLQAKEQKKEYNQMTNTLNTVDRPAGELHEVHLSADGHGEEEGGHSHTEGAGHDTDDHGHTGAAHSEEGH